MKITQEENELLLDLARTYDYPEFDKTKHVTANMLADEVGISHRAAYERLEAEYKEGNLDKERVRMENGCRAWGYFRGDKT